MSGSHFGYKENMLCYEVFDMSPNHSFETLSHDADAKAARARNPLEDETISELVYEAICLIHSFDYYKSDDTDEEAYRKDVDFFKAKWLKGRK